MSKTALCRIGIVLTFLTCDIARAHDQIPGAPPRQPIAIIGATVHVGDGPVIRNGTVLFDGGRIKAVGRSIKIPRTAQRIDADGMHVYPGLIESMTDLGLREISAVDATVDHTEFGKRNPNVRSWVAINPDSELIPVARSGGVLIANVAPQGDWIRGQAAAVQLDGWTADEMVLSAPTGLCVNWNSMEPRGDDEKEALKKREQKFKDLDKLLDQARRYADGRAERPKETPTDVRLESLLPLIEGTRPLIAQADQQHVIESAVAYAQQHALKLIIYGGYDAAECSELLNRYDVPVILGGIYRLPLRRHDPYDAAFTLPERLRKAGVRFCIAGEGPGYPGGASNTRNLPYHAACAVAYGLPRDQALRAITLSAAEIFGVDNRVGSVVAGKDATLIIADGDILETESHVIHAFIQGRRVDLGNRHRTLYKKYQLKYSRQAK